MEFDPNDYDIVLLLAKLKNSDSPYPSDLLASRRQNYLRHVAEIGMGFGVAIENKKPFKRHIKSGSRGTATIGVVEATLLIAIAIEAVLVAFFYRDKITEWIGSSPSTPVISTVSPHAIEMDYSATPEVTGIPVHIPPSSGTPSPILTTDNNFGSDDISLTSNPSGNSGNHFGQTPKPERTKKPVDDKDRDDKDKGKDK